MPAIRDEVWKISPSFQEGINFLKERDPKQIHESVRFSGLGMNASVNRHCDESDAKQVISALKESQSKNVCFDWLEMDDAAVKALSEVSNLENELESFHLTMIDLGTARRLAPICSVVQSNARITDLVLTFCKINDKNIGDLARAFEQNRTILSLNLNFNLLRKDGYLLLAESLVKNQTLRYLEAKMNKAEKPDLKAFITKLSENQTIEFIDVGQADDIDGVIKTNGIPEQEEKRKPSASLFRKKSTKDKTKEVTNAPVEGEGTNTAVVEQTGTENTADNNDDLYTQVKDLVARNKTARKALEKDIKMDFLRDILERESKTIRASFKHSKILFLGDKASGKTFFAHCLVHQLFDGTDKRKLKTVSNARVTELGWTKISKFHHVDMVLAKKISTVPEVRKRRSMANEVCFQFPEDVVISDKDLKSTFLDTEDEHFLSKLKIKKSKGTSEAPVFDQQENTKIIERFSRTMDNTIDKALRENNYPSFSLWDFDTPEGYDEIFRYFFNEHGLVFVFFDLRKLKDTSLANPFKAAIASVRTYLRPLNLARASKKELSVKVMLVGTFLDELLNAGVDAGVEKGVEKYKQVEESLGLKLDGSDGHFDFLKNELDNDDHLKTVTSVQQMLMAFNVELIEALNDCEQSHIVSNDADNLFFFPLGNDIPKMGQTFKKDFDDISGINKFRKSVRTLLDQSEIKIVNVMKSLRDASVIDKLIERKSQESKGPQDHAPHYITRKDFEELVAKSGITSQADVAVLLRYLDVTGIVSWQIGSQILQDVIILDPNYLVKGVEEFYKGCNSHVSETLKEEINKAGLSAHLESFETKHIISHDLLEKVLCPEDKNNFAFFKEFLLRAFHLNRVDLHLLTKVFEKQNLVDSKDEADDLFLVPSFKPESSVEGNVGATTGFAYRLIPAQGLFARGTFERAFTMILSSFEAASSKLSETKNCLEYSLDTSKFTFGDDVITFSKLVSDAENCQEGFLEFTFASESAVKLLFHHLERVMEKMGTDFPDDCKFTSYALSNGEWMSMDKVRQDKIEPYFDGEVNIQEQTSGLFDESAFEGL